jgi:hypothetical protein
VKRHAITFDTPRKHPVGHAGMQNRVARSTAEQWSAWNSVPNGVAALVLREVR